MTGIQDDAIQRLAEAREKIKQVHVIWPGISELENIENSIAPIENEYDDLMKDIEIYMSKCKFKEAEELCNKVLKICPYSSQLNEVLTELGEYSSLISEREAKRKDAIISFFRLIKHLVITLCIVGIAGGILWARV